MQPGRSGPKADTEARTLRGERWSTTRCTRKGPERRQQAELPRRRLKGGSDATGAVVVRPTWPGFSPGRLAEGGKVKNDAFNKVNGARGRRRHWPAADLGFRLHPIPSPEPNNPQGSTRAAARSTRPGTATARPGASGGSSGTTKTPTSTQATGPPREVAAAAATRPPPADQAAHGGGNPGRDMAGTRPRQPRPR